MVQHILMMQTGKTLNLTNDTTSTVPPTDTGSAAIYGNNANSILHVLHKIQ